MVLILPVVVIMLAAGPFVTCRVTETSEMTPYYRTKLFDMVGSGTPLAKIQEEMRRMGVGPNDVVDRGSTLLSTAVNAGRRDVVRWLLEQGADPDGRHPDARTPPLCYAGDLWMARELVAAGADPDYRREPRSMSPRERARERYASMPSNDHWQVMRFLDSAPPSTRPAASGPATAPAMWPGR